MKLTIRSFKVRFEVGSEEETEQVIRYTDDGRLFFRGYIQNHVLSRKQYIRLTGHDQALVNDILYSRVCLQRVIGSINFAQFQVKFSTLYHCNICRTPGVT